MTQSESLSEFLCRLLAKAANKRTVEVDADLWSLGVDSLAFSSLIAQVEMRFAVELTTDDVMELLEVASVRELVNRVERLIQLRAT